MRSKESVEKDILLFMRYLTYIYSTSTFNKMKQVAWFERKFHFDFDQNIFPSIIERLRGAPLRLRQMIAHLAPKMATHRADGKWSIAEQIGHLSDLEPLWQYRLADILNGVKEMRSADLTNAATNQANHNSQSIEELVNHFEELREITISRLELLDEELVYRSSLHPRLKKPMRVMDLYLFTAEHDDHHLTAIRAQIQALTTS